ncbi:MAG: nucleotidyltransferase [Aureispira sp.]
MTADNYIIKIINKKKSPNLTFYDSRLTDIKRVIRKWAGSQLSEIKLSGSCIKKTALKGKSDCDLFISLKPTTSNTLKYIYESLNNSVKSAGYNTIKQNVSIAIKTNGLDIDLVPARIIAGSKNYHNLYLSKKDSRLQTNIEIHINNVVNSGRQEEIMAAKIWRELNGLKFPSVYLELVIIDALKYKRKKQPAKNFITVLEYFRDSFVNKSFIDPSNSNNFISNMIYKYQKEEIQKAARKSLKQKNWEDIIY